MDLKPYANAYKHPVVDCPFCNGWAYVRDVSTGSPDPLRDLKRHITNQAKNEALLVALTPGIQTPHLAYYKEHTSDQKVVLAATKRKYDDDLKIKS